MENKDVVKMTGLIAALGALAVGLTQISDWSENESPWAPRSLIVRVDGIEKRVDKNDTALLGVQRWHVRHELMGVNFEISKYENNDEQVPKGLMEMRANLTDALSVLSIKISNITKEH